MPLDLAQPWNEQPIVVIDTETTGVGADHAVVEIAAVRFEHGRVTAEYASLIDPQRDIPADATAVHGITADMVRGKPTLEDVAVDLFQIAQDAAPCAYNAPFDRAFVHAAIAGTDCPAFDPGLSWIDVYEIVASPRIDKYVKGPGRLKLGNVCQRWQVELEGAHRALGDARATGKLPWCLFEQQRVKPVSLGRLLEHTDHMRAEHNADFARWKARQSPTELFSEETPREQ
jgi:DNA polymerase III epsilon subunit family exonuclease